jgi:hypothetical protein
MDTRGTLADCQRFAKHIRIMLYLCRIMSDGIDIVYFKALLKRLTKLNKIEYIVRFKENNNYMY